MQVTLKLTKERMSEFFRNFDIVGDIKYMQY